MREFLTLPQPRRENEIRTYYARSISGMGTRSTGGRRRSRFEVIVGAYLTQNTAWTNVERALANLRAAGRA